MERSQLFWQTYLNLEKELLETAKYIYITDEITIHSRGRLVSEPCKTQLETFSPHIADLLIRTCVEIEAISKELYYNFGGPKARGDKDIHFDEDCLKLIDINCKTHKKVVVVSCVSFNLTKEENLYFKPLKEAHKRQGTDWEKAYQALKHDRYSSLSKGTVKSLLHAMGALFLLNIYFKNVKLTARYLGASKLDLSFGSSIFSVKRPSDKYVIDIINNHDIVDCLHADESPFVMKYTDSYYKAVLDANKKALEEMKAYLIAQPELNEPEFIQQMQQARENESRNPSAKLIPFWELSKYRMRKKAPSSLPFEERKKLLVSSQEWVGRKQLNSSLNEANITEETIQAEVDQTGVVSGMKLQRNFESLIMQKAFAEGYCELILDKGDVRYNR